MRSDLKMEGNRLLRNAEALCKGKHKGSP
jgi:hypothetical protein